MSEAYNVTFPAGVTSVSFSFPIINDNILEDDENFILTIDPSSAPDDVNGGQATVTIVDDDRKWFVKSINYMHCLSNSAMSKAQQI